MTDINFIAHFSFQGIQISYVSNDNKGAEKLTLAISHHDINFLMPVPSSHGKIK